MLQSNPTFDALCAALHAQTPPRLWSLVVTILGDVAFPRGGWIAMSAIHEIVEDLGFESGALRTAMSRLSADGWVERRKDGRNSWYRLARSHNDEFLAASDSVYSAVGNTGDGPWTIYIAAPGEPSAVGADGWVLRPGVVLLQGTLPSATLKSSQSLEITGALAPLPDWVRAIIAPADHRQRLDWFSKLLSATSINQARALPPRSALGLRVLMIHEWRRLVLRHPPVPSSLAPRDWPEDLCRARITALYPVLYEQTEGKKCLGRFTEN